MTSTGISLLTVVKAFSSPINEEQAWALCYQVIRHVQTSLKKEEGPSTCYRYPIITSLEDVILLKDGSVGVQAEQEHDQDEPSTSSCTSGVC